VALNSCTAALHLALIAAGVGPGDEVVTTPITFAATANVICHLGARPVFVDVRPDTLNLDPDRLKEAVTPRTRAIVPVHYIGQPVDMDPVLDVARQHGLVVVEDAAHAIETVYRGRKVGAISDMTAFSFYATKNLTTGEGGMLTTRRDDLIDRLRILSLHGISKDAWKRYDRGGSLQYDILEPGFKYNMFDIQAALGLHQLDKVEAFRRRRKELVERYHAAFEGLPGIAPLLQAEGPGNVNAYHLYVVRVLIEELGVSRDEFAAALTERGVGLGIHFRAVHLHPYYERTFKLGYGHFPHAEYASDRILSLPLYPRMTDDEQDFVIDAVRATVRQFS